MNNLYRLNIVREGGKEDNYYLLVPTGSPLEVYKLVGDGFESVNPNTCDKSLNPFLIEPVEGKVNLIQILDREEKHNLTKKAVEDGIRRAKEKK